MNLIGGQVDYHEGWVVVMAIDRDVRVRATARADGRVIARSAEIDGRVEVAADGRDDPTTVRPEWGRTVAGVTRVLAEHGRAPVGADLDISSTVPLGAGLSSSAAFEVACALALADVAGLDVGGTDLALAAQRAEHVATGVPCGIQDQIASVLGRAGHALFLDCRTLAVEHVPLHRELCVLVVHSGIPRMLSGTPYAQRRAESEAVAAGLGLPFLRDATFEQVRDLPRGRHAVTEMVRVREFARALRERRPRRARSAHAREPHVVARRHGGLDPRAGCARRVPRRRGRVRRAPHGCGFRWLRRRDRARRRSRVDRRARTCECYRARTGREPIAWIVHAASGAGTAQ